MFLRPKSASRGSAPLELVALVTILLLPIAPMVGLFQLVSDQLAAESIARAGLRYAFLSGDLGADPSPRLRGALEQLARSWEKEISGFELNCQNCRTGGLLELSVRVGSARALQSAGLEPE